jgi:hypothetical protein
MRGVLHGGGPNGPPLLFAAGMMYNTFDLSLFSFCLWTAAIVLGHFFYLLKTCNQLATKKQVRKGISFFTVFCYNKRKSGGRKSWTH